MKVEDKKKLGEMVGLCKIDKEGNPRKVVGCSCVVVKVIPHHLSLLLIAQDYGEEGEALQVLLDHLKKQ